MNEPYMESKKIEYKIKMYGVATLLLIAVYYLLDLKVLESWNEYIPFMKKLSMSLFLIAFIFLISKIIARVIYVQTHIEGDRYNLLRVIRFLAICVQSDCYSFLFVPKPLCSSC